MKTALRGIRRLLWLETAHGGGGVTRSSRDRRESPADEALEQIPRGTHHAESRERRDSRWSRTTSQSSYEA